MEEKYKFLLCLIIVFQSMFTKNMGYFVKNDTFIDVVKWTSFYLFWLQMLVSEHMFMALKNVWNVECIENSELF